MSPLHPCLSCARHFRVTEARCPFCGHAGFSTASSTLALCAVLAFSACTRDASVATPTRPVARDTTVAALTDAAALDATMVADASGDEPAPIPADAATPDGDASDARAARRRTRRAMVSWPSREYVPLYGDVPKTVVE